MRRRTMLYAAPAAALLAVLGGCQGHGKYTSAFKEEAQLRMAGMKAATEFDMARQQFLAGDLEKALKTTDSSIALNDRVPRSHVLRGRILVEQSRLETALDSLGRAVELTEEIVADRLEAGGEPMNEAEAQVLADAHFYRGVIHERFSAPGEALACYRAAAEADPSNPQYAVAQAEMLIEQARLDEAAALLEDEKQRFRHNAGVRQTLGHIALMQGDPQRAIEHFNDACLLAPHEPGLLEDLARAQLEAGEPAAALSNIELILSRLEAKEGPEREDLRRLQADCLLALDRPVEAREILRGLVGAPGGDADVQAWIGLGNASLRLGDWSGVRRAGQRLAAAAPKSPEGYLFLALHQHNAGRAEDAVESLSAAIERVDQPANPALLRAVILKELGRRGEALESVEVALLHEPGHAQAEALHRELSSAAFAEAPVD